MTKHTTPRLELESGPRTLGPWRDRYYDYRPTRRWVTAQHATCGECLIRHGWVLPKVPAKYVWLTLSDKWRRDAVMVRFSCGEPRESGESGALSYTFHRQKEPTRYLFGWFQRWLRRHFPQLRTKGVHRLYLGLHYQEDD